MRIEFLKACEDYTWCTEIIDVPDEDIDPEGKCETSALWDAILEWVHKNVATQALYRDVVFWAIYNDNP